MLFEDGRFTIVADRIMREIPGQYQVKATDISTAVAGSGKADFKNLA